MIKSKKIRLILVFSLIAIIKGYGQTAAPAVKAMYKISPEKAKAMVIDEKRFENISKGNKSVYSCEIDPVTKKAIVSVKDEKGVISKETYELKEEKK